MTVHAKPLVTYVVRVEVAGVRLPGAERNIYDPRFEIVGVVFVHGYGNEKHAELIATKKYRASLPQIRLLNWDNASDGERREAVAAESRALIRLL